jgi:hypothetical protein
MYETHSQTMSGVNADFPQLGRYFSVPAMPAPRKRGVLKRVKSVDEALALPPGTRFVDPEGNERVR